MDNQQLEKKTNIFIKILKLFFKMFLTKPKIGNKKYKKVKQKHIYY